MINPDLVIGIPHKKPTTAELSAPAFSSSTKPLLSIIIPTYNESQNIMSVLKSVGENVPLGILAEIVVVDDNSPDGTGGIVRRLISDTKDEDQQEKSTVPVKLVSRPHKSGLSSAVIDGIVASSGKFILVMDSDFSHPPHMIPAMVEELQDPECDIVVASRYVKGGAVMGWPFKRRLISKGATRIARHGLGVHTRDPMSGFFAFKRHVINDIEFDAIGYKVLLEILVKTKGARIKEIPYVFTNRKSGSSKLDASVITDYIKAVWRLYRYGNLQREKERRLSVRFLSKAARFYTIGASGVFINYIVSLLSGSVMPDLWYLHASIIGIVTSMTSNFFLNKMWTFEDMDFSLRKTLTQYGLFLGFSTIGALVQLGMLFLLVESYGIDYPIALIIAVAIAAVGNFLLNKKWTFKEKIWS